MATKVVRGFFCRSHTGAMPSKIPGSGAEPHPVHPTQYQDCSSRFSGPVLHSVAETTGALS